MNEADKMTVEQAIRLLDPATAYDAAMEIIESVGLERGYAAMKAKYDEAARKACEALRESEDRQESKALRERYGEYVMFRSPFGLHCGGGGSTGVPMQHGGGGKGTCMIPLVYEEL